MQKKENRIIVISGSTAAGKGTIIRELVSRHPNDLQLVKSVTTRPPRGDKDPADAFNYIHVSDGEFREFIDSGDMLEYELVHGSYYYGKRKIDIENVLENANAIMEINIDGFHSLRKIYREKIISIFIVAPSEKEVEKRLRLRGTDSEENIRKRIDVSMPKEMENIRYYDYTIVNDVVKRAVREAELIIFGKSDIILD